MTSTIDGRWTLRRRVRTLFLAAAIVAALLLGLGTIAFRNVLDARAEVLDRHVPALQAADQYYSAMLAQQNAVRGVLLSGAPEFLRGFDEAAARSAEAASRLRVLVEGRALRARLEEILDRAERWQDEFAAAELDARAAGDEVPPDVVDRSRAVFEVLEADVRALQEDVGAQRDQAQMDLNDATRVLVVALSVAAAALVMMGLAIRTALRRWVTEPLVDLAGEAAQVQQGTLDRPISATGPFEIRQLGEAVDAMRGRIQRELSEVEEARALLVESSEELARSNRDLEQFAYVASHDLQEPLRKVTSFCQLLQQRYGGQLDERAEQYIEFAVDGAKRMQDLINDLLAFSRVGRLASSFDVVDLRRAVDRALENAADVVEETGAVLRIGDLPTVRGEPNLLAAVFQNLIGNALKFRRSGVTPEVTVEATRRDEAWEIVVADNGIGIAPEYSERVFVIFQRLHGKEVYTGTGIGLALCRRIVEHHGGEIWVDSTVPAGTTIRFTLPDRPPESEGTDDA